jgi:imidazoleglycerol-phosphate dehydratase
MRTAAVNRKTNETDITLEINLDSIGKHTIDTGIGFLDHMLSQIAVHGMCDLSIKVKGDLVVDPHHTVEDCGLVLGSAFKQALGDKRGLTRMASATVPMDEALGQVIVDFSGRPYAVLSTKWTSPTVGNLSTTLIEHFFESFAFASAATLHVLVHYGRDNHHISESLFKAFGRAVSDAVRVDPRRKDTIPSSKGVL